MSSTNSKDATHSHIDQLLSLSTYSPPSSSYMHPVQGIPTLILSSITHPSYQMCRRKLILSLRRVTDAPALDHRTMGCYDSGYGWAWPPMEDKGAALGWRRSSVYGGHTTLLSFQQVIPSRKGSWSRRRSCRCVSWYRLRDSWVDLHRYHPFAPSFLLGTLDLCCKCTWSSFCREVYI